MSNTAKLKKKAAELEQKKQFDRALQIYIQLLEEAGRELDDVDVPLYNRVGDLLMRQGNTSDALAYYEKAVDVYAERGFLNNAIALCNKVLRQSPARTSVYYKLGKISAAKGFKSDAKKNFLEYADRMQKAGQLNEAFRALKEFADLCPDQEDVRLMLAELLSKENRKSEALEQLHALHEKLEHEGRGAEARATIDRMKAIDPAAVPRPSGTQQVQRGGDLVFLDLNDDPSEDVPALSPRQEYATPQGAVPPLDGMSLTFLPDKVEQAEGVTESEAIDGLELASAPTIEDIDALLAPLPGLVRSGQFDAIPDEERDEALEDLQLVDLETASTDEALGEDDEGLDELEGLERNQVGGAEPAEVTTAPASLQEGPLSGSEFAEMELQESSFLRMTPSHDLVLPSGLPLLRTSGSAAEDKLVQPTEVAAAPYAASAEGLLLGEPDFGTHPEPIEEDVAEIPALDSDSPINLGDAVQTSTAETHSGEPESTELPQMEAVEHPSVASQSAQTESASASRESQRSGAPRVARLSDEIELRYIHSGPLTLPEGPSVATPERSTPAMPDPTLLASAGGDDEVPAGSSTERDTDALFSEPAPGILDDLEVTGAPSASASESGVDSDTASSDLLSSTPGFGVPKEAELDHTPRADDSADSLRPDHWLGELAPDAVATGETATDDASSDGASHVDSSVAGPVLRPVFDDLSAAMMWSGTRGNDANAASGADGAVPEAHRAPESPRGRIVFGSVQDQLRSRLELDPANWPLRRQLAEVLLDSGDRESGMQELDLAMVGFELAGDLIGAQEVADLIIRVIPTSVRHHQKRVEYAVRASDRVRLVETYLELGDALFRTGDPDKASVVYARVLELSPGNERAKFALGTLVAVPPAAPATLDIEERPEVSDFALDFADVAVRAAERELVRTTTSAQDASEADADAVEDALGLASEAILGAKVATDGEPVRAMEAGVGKEAPAETSEADVDSSDLVGSEAVVGEAAVTRAESFAAGAQASSDEVGASDAVAESDLTTPQEMASVAAADRPASNGSGAHPTDASDDGASDDPSAKEAAPARDTSALDTTFLRKQTAPRAAEGDARMLRQARAMTPIGVRDDEFVDLGDWLRLTEPQKSTRMVVEETAPSGDEQADFEEMLRHFKRGISENVDEEDYASHYDLGVAYKEMGLTDEAIAEFQKSLRGESHRVRSYEALGQCFVEKGQFQVAGTLLQRAIETATAGDHELVGVLYLMGYAAESLGRRADALRYYQRVFSVDIEFRDVAQRVAAMEHSTQ